MRLTKEMITRLENYKAEDYIYDLGALGLEETWFRICGFVEKNKKSVPEFLDVKNFGELYEEALAFQDKNRKKNRGQYYTPDDVSQVMSRWLDACEGDAVCDVGCGTGNLILNYLEYIGSERALNFINSGKLFLYDADPLALEICKTAITVKFGAGLKKKINCICGDFLDASLRLPKNCKVIANPPYAEIKEIQSCWEQTDVLAQSKDFYAVFMEKVVKQAKSVVIITPFTFVSGNKYGYLRKEMCQNGNGFVVSFDNVPGNIFCGRKHGVFNSNTSNSVRAAITVFHKSAKKHGFRISPLLRFKTEEREKLLQCEVLENKLPATFQVVDETKPFQKVDRALEGLFEAWMQSSTHTVADLVSKEETPYFIDMPNTCRYFTTAGKRKLKRKGSISFYAKDEKSYYFLYCMINSGFAYWWWRIFDGAITFSHDLFFRMPLPYDLLKTGDRNFFKKTAQQMMQEEDNYIITKMNAGTVQENIKFPEKYRESINGRILEILGQPGDLGEDLLKIHSNSFFEEDTMTETLGKKQEEILKKFYTGPSEKVLLNKSERDALWKKTKQKKTYDSSVPPDIKCPALFHQIQRSMESGNNIQSAVFSECVYAQTLANMFGLEKFVNCEEDDFSFPEGVKNLLSSNNLEPRYVYLSKDNTGMLIQAGGCEGVDSAYITIPELSIYTIEFKEPYAKTSEPDLPKYDESGKLVIEEEWIRKNPQFKKMIYEHTDLNFFDNMGKNIHDFTYDSVAYAVERNYQSKKKADVICTEDQNGFFVMIPANHASQWAEIEGEIRPAGRNHYKVWTKDALKGFLKAMDAVGDRRIGVDKSKLKIRNPRGGEDVPTGYKINSLFFVLAENCEEKDGMIYFDIDDVRQIKPTIAGKMSFKNLRYEDVKKYYGFIAEKT